MTLNEDFSVLSLKNIKEAIIYEYSINLEKKTQKEINESKSILKKFKIEEH